MANAAEILLKVKAIFDDRASAAASRFAQRLNGVAGAAGKVGSAMGSMGSEVGGKMGAVAAGIGNVVQAFAALGPVAAVAVGGIQVAQFALSQMEKSVEAFRETTEKMSERVRARLEDMKAAKMEKMSLAIRAATTDAEKAARAFDEMAAAYRRVDAQRNATSRAADERAVAGMGLSKANAVAAAGSSDAAQTAGAEWDVKIAQKRLSAALSRQAEATGEAEREARDSAESLRMARERVAEAEKTVAVCEEEYASTAALSAKERKPYAERLAQANAALEAARHGLAVGTQAHAAVEEKCRTVAEQQAAAVAGARAAVVNAEKAQRDLADAQAKAAEEERRLTNEKARKAEARAQADEERRQTEEEASLRLASIDRKMADSKEREERARTLRERGQSGMQTDAEVHSGISGRGYVYQTDANGAITRHEDAQRAERYAERADRRRRNQENREKRYDEQMEKLASKDPKHLSAGERKRLDTWRNMKEAQEGEARERQQQDNLKQERDRVLFTLRDTVKEINDRLQASLDVAS